MKNTINTPLRLFEIIHVFFYVLWMVCIQERRSSIEKKAIILRKSIEKLGSVFIKLGQMLSLRPDYLSIEYCHELYKLLDQVPSFSKQEVEQIIQRELKGTTKELFSEFNPIPIASASFAQVHRAKLTSGEIVAVKIQRPNIGERINSDISLLKIAAQIFDFMFKPANKISNIISEFELWTKDELNYTFEAKNIEIFNHFQNIIHDNIRGPYVFKKFSTTKIITIEFVEGYSLAQIIQAVRNNDRVMQNKLKLWGFKGDEIVNALMRNSLEMSHIHGFFHADPHPANIIFNKKHELIYIDFGIVGNLSQKERILILRYVRSMLMGDSQDSFRALVALCTDSSRSNFEKVKEEYEKISQKINETFDSSTYLEQQKKSGPILIEALNLFQKNNFKVPISLVRYFKAFETIEGLIFSLYPHLQVKSMAKEFQRVSIMSVVDLLPSALEEKRLDSMVLKALTAIEDVLLLK